MDKYMGASSNIGHLDWMVKQGVDLSGLKFNGYWFDIGNIVSLLEAEDFLKKQK